MIERKYSFFHFNFLFIKFAKTFVGTEASKRSSDLECIRDWTMLMIQRRELLLYWIVFRK